MFDLDHVIFGTKTLHDNALGTPLKGPVGTYTFAKEVAAALYALVPSQRSSIRLSRVRLGFGVLRVDLFLSSFFLLLLRVIFVQMRGGIDELLRVVLLQRFLHQCDASTGQDGPGTGGMSRLDSSTSTTSRRSLVMKGRGGRQGAARHLHGLLEGLP